MSQELTKKFGLKEGISLVVGIIIGSGVFFKASMVFKYAGSIHLGLLAWVLGGILTLCAGLTISEIASAIPKTARVPFAMAKDELLPFKDKITKTFGKDATPLNSIMITFVLTIIYILTGSFHALTELIIFSVWIFFLLGMFGVFILRKRKDINLGKYTVPFFPIVPIIGICGASFILVNTLISSPKNALMGMCITLLGIPVYYFVKKSYTK